MSLRATIVCLFFALSLTASAAAATPRDATTGELPLGKPYLKETRTTQQIAPGVTYTRIVRGEQSKKDFYTVDVAFKADQSSADSIAAQLQSDGYKSWVQEIAERAPDDPQSVPLGYLVRTGAFATEAKANALRDQLAADGYRHWEPGLCTVYFVMTCSVGQTAREDPRAEWSMVPRQAVYRP